MRKLILTIALTLLAALPASAQRINIDIPGLADRAEEVVDVTVDGPMLRLAAKFFSDRKADERAIRDIITGLHGIYVRSYQFAKEGEYDLSIVERVKAQLGPSWKPLVTVRSKKKNNVNVYADMRGDKIVGLVVISAEPRELTLVNINGPIDLDRLSQLEGQFGIPDISEDSHE